MFVAGQTALDSTGRIVAPNDIVRQFECVMENIVKVLQAAEARCDHVVKMTIFVSDVGLYRKHLREIGEVYKKFFGRHYPAMTLVEISKFFDTDAMIEIEAVAVISKG